jgi:hypothetical protein
VTLAGKIFSLLRRPAGKWQGNRYASDMRGAISSLSQMKIAETASKYGPGFPAGKLPERFLVG